MATGSLLFVISRLASYLLGIMGPQVEHWQENRHRLRRFTAARVDDALQKVFASAAKR